MIAGAKLVKARLLINALAQKQMVAFVFTPLGGMVSYEYLVSHRKPNEGLTRRKRQSISNQS